MIVGTGGHRFVVDDYDDLICSIGNNEFRKTILDKAKNLGYHYIPTIIYKSAYVSVMAQIGIIVWRLRTMHMLMLVLYV